MAYFCCGISGIRHNSHGKTNEMSFRYKGSPCEDQILLTSIIEHEENASKMSVGMCYLRNYALETGGGRGTKHVATMSESTWLYSTILR
ncbi:protein-tyrosine-phosphatase MKP1-like [Gossypium australe]|uniref:Protein-tyrosine-phosphatase MKP1-like n=1 Tax=Gossypium australe TaxID=47621 RepID=A0A5B6V569_9ROSI|nr:protein-tyrosine-phosphatase MKP1-like [Gossypium australe]